MMGLVVGNALGVLVHLLSGDEIKNRLEGFVTGFAHWHLQRVGDKKHPI